MKIKELFKIAEGVNVWNLTSSDTEEVFGGDTYTPTAIGRTGSENKKELSRANVEISMSIDNPIARRWLNQIIDNIVTITIWTKQDADYIVSWKGRLASVRPDNATIKLVFESVFTSLRRTGLRRVFQRNCPYVLYGRGCNLDKEDFAVGGTVTGKAGADITVAAASAQVYTGGIVKAADGTLRFIIRQSGTTLTMIRPIDSQVNGQAVTVYPGCDRTRSTCDSRFNNLLNNGSTPFIPDVNPFGGSSFT